VQIKIEILRKSHFKVVQMKFLAMHITNQKLSFDTLTVVNLQNILYIKISIYLLAIATNIPVLLMTGFVVQGHFCYRGCVSIFGILAILLIWPVRDRKRVDEAPIGSGNDPTWIQTQVSHVHNMSKHMLYPSGHASDLFVAVYFLNITLAKASRNKISCNFIL